jgi:hypothetical protein
MEGNELIRVEYEVASERNPEKRRTPPPANPCRRPPHRTSSERRTGPPTSVCTPLPTLGGSALPATLSSAAWISHCVTTG